MDKKLNEICEILIPTKLTITRYNTKSYNTINTNIPYNFPAFSAENNAKKNGSTSLYALIRIKLLRAT